MISAPTSERNRSGVISGWPRKILRAISAAPRHQDSRIYAHPVCGSMGNPCRPGLCDPCPELRNLVVPGPIRYEIGDEQRCLQEVSETWPRCMRMLVSKMGSGVTNQGNGLPPAPATSGSDRNRSDGHEFGLQSRQPTCPFALRCQPLKTV